MSLRSQTVEQHGRTGKAGTTSNRRRKRRLTLSLPVS